MKELTKAAKPVSIPKKPSLQGWFFHIWRKRLIPKEFDLNAVIKDQTNISPKKCCDA
ncbi:hypothetical protein [Vibrio rotiferianus]|uniref:hypothetical protein n=1 Tax=Vibrio rotiferianus TaxID=190895 RepID=UPI001486D964|nr:hypothetical protein [Vibrio rotiferianus]